MSGDEAGIAPPILIQKLVEALDRSIRGIDPCRHDVLTISNREMTPSDSTLWLATSMNDFNPKL
jgi:hypothetical protein